MLSRISHDELRALFEGYGHAPLFVEGDEPDEVHQALAAALERAVERCRHLTVDGVRLLCLDVGRLVAVSL